MVMKRKGLGGAVEEHGEWLTVPEAARRLNVARPTVLQRALLGELTHTVFAGDVYIGAESVAAALASAEHAFA